MNVSIITHIYPTQHDKSSGIFIQNEARLIQQFAQVRVFIPTVFATPLNKQFYRSYQLVSEDFEMQRFHYLSFPRRKLQAITQYSISKSLINALPPAKSTHIVHLHWLYPGGLTATALKKKGYNLVLTLHGGDWYSNLKNGKPNTILTNGLFACNHIITVGQQLKDDILNTFPELEKRITHLKHAIDTKLFQPSNSKTELKKKLNWSLQKTHLLCVANLYEAKGVDILVESFANLPHSENLLLHIVAPRYNKKVKKKVFDMINSYGLTNKIHFYNSMPKEKLIQYYQAADLFVSPSRKEGFGLAMAEAAACGTPILATMSGGAEQIINKKLGVLVEACNPKSITNGIIDILKKLDYYKPSKMHHDISKRFSKKQKANAIQKVYKQVQSSKY